MHRKLLFGKRISFFILLLVPLSPFSSGQQPIRGFIVARSAEERKLEQAFLQLPDTAKCRDYLFYLTRFGLKPSKILFLAWSAWAEKYDYATLKKWLSVFITRFFANQYKRSAVPNGPKIVSGGALSPRGDWRMPSDASAAVWLAELNDNTPEALD